MVDFSFWANKKVLITGHTGFKGSWLCLLLRRLGAIVSGYSLSPVHKEALYNKTKYADFLAYDYHDDIRNPVSLLEAIKKVQPDIVFHLAAQPLVIDSYKNPVETFSTNINGTLNLLEIVRTELNSPINLVVVTSDKCYLNTENKQFFDESSSLGGNDPYSASKAMTEILVGSYHTSFLKEKGHLISTGRAGNVIGAGDFSENRLIPDFFRSYHSENKTLTLRSPLSIRPWQHVLEALYGYIKLVEVTSKEDNIVGAFNFGPHKSHHLNVGSVIEKINILLENTFLLPSVQIKYTSSPSFQESKFLYLDIKKASHFLKWFPQLSLEETLEWTIEGYILEKNDLNTLAEQQIERYLKKVIT